MSAQPYAPPGGALFDGFGNPIGPSPWPDVGSMMEARPLCRVLLPLDDTFEVEVDGDGVGVGCDLIYALPAGGPSPIPDGIMGHLAATIASGEAIALHGTDDDALVAAVGAILAVDEAP